MEEPALRLVCMECLAVYAVYAEGADAALFCLGTKYGVCDDCGGQLQVVEADANGVLDLDVVDAGQW